MKEKIINLKELMDEIKVFNIQIITHESVSEEGIRKFIEDIPIQKAFMVRLK